MRISSRAEKAFAQGVFYLAILTLLVSRAASGNISHDESQFIAPGQFLAYDGLAPYVDYPYTHMPYAVPFYALSAAVSDYDLLAGRLMSTLFWLASIVLIVAIGRCLSGKRADVAGGPSWTRLLWEFGLVLAFVLDPTAQFILRTALNHSPSTFFGLLAMLFFVRGIRQVQRPGSAALWSGVCIAAAGLTRFTYASLAVVLLAGWLVYGVLAKPPAWKPLVLRFGAGLSLASLPALGLAALAPRQFYFSNVVYVRLNTVYYEVILHRSGMDMASKLSGFGSVLRAEPMQVLLYAALLFTIITVLVKARRDKAVPDIARLVVSAAAFTMCLTAFAPTPMVLQYLAAPLPFLFIVLESIEIEPARFRTGARALGGLALAALVLSGLVKQNPIADLARLAQPDQWPPVQVHELAMSIRGGCQRGGS